MFRIVQVLYEVDIEGSCATQGQRVSVECDVKQKPPSCTAENAPPVSTIAQSLHRHSQHSRSQPAIKRIKEPQRNTFAEDAPAAC